MHSQANTLASEKQKTNTKNQWDTDIDTVRVDCKSREGLNTKSRYFYLFLRYKQEAAIKQT